MRGGKAAKEKDGTRGLDYPLSTISYPIRVIRGSNPSHLLRSKTIFLQSKGIFLRSKTIFLQSKGIFLQSKSIFLRSKIISLRSKMVLLWKTTVFYTARILLKH
jgi:hypothetical protein